MAISKEKKQLFQKVIAPYKQKIEELKRDISKLKIESVRNKNIEPFLMLKAAVVTIAYSNTLVLMSKLSERIQEMKNKNYLDQARRELSNRVNELNKIFGDQIDSSLTENKEMMENIAQVKPAHKLRVLQEMSNAIQNVKENLGETSKWRWSFPDLHYRYVVFLKNLFDFRHFEQTKDTNDENYYPLQEYLQKLLDEAQCAAQEFRSRYELSTQEIDDLNKIRDIFEMQKQIYTVTGKQDELERIQTSLDNISEKIENLVAKKSEKNNLSESIAL